ncbi:endolytic transglycosylase MltG, partial [Escherichia coli]|nr:endolytic transglycosylase MltG [Escherichia coli]
PEPTKIADGKVTIPEGYDIDKIGEAIEKNTDFKKADFIALMKNEDFFNQMKAKYPDLLESAATAEGVRYRLEGYLFPATYDYY